MDKPKKLYKDYKKPNRMKYLRAVIWAYEKLIVKYTKPIKWENQKEEYYHDCPLCEQFRKGLSCLDCPNSIKGSTYNCNQGDTNDKLREVILGYYRCEFTSAAIKNRVKYLRKQLKMLNNLYTEG